LAATPQLNFGDGMNAAVVAYACFAYPVPEPLTFPRII